MTKIEGLEVEKELFIRAYFDGIMDKIHSRRSTMFTTYRCGIDMVKSSINFESVVVSAEEKLIAFNHWTFITARCQADHGTKLKYKISQSTNATQAIDCVTQVAECTTAACKFTVDPSCVKNGQDANVIACFDGKNSDTVCTEENSKHSDEFDIIKVEPGSDGGCNVAVSGEDAEIFAHS